MKDIKIGDKVKIIKCSLKSPGHEGAIGVYAGKRHVGYRGNYYESVYIVGIDEECDAVEIEKVKRGRPRKIAITTDVSGEDLFKNCEVEETRRWKIVGGYELSVTKKNGVFEKAFLSYIDTYHYTLTEEQLHGLKNALNEI